MNKEPTKRDLIRSLTIGSKKHFKRKCFTLVTSEGDIEVEFREPSRKERAKITDKSRDKKGQVDNELFIANFVIMLTFIPGTNERVFEDADLEAIMETPAASGFVEKFGEQILELIKPDDIKETEKNLGLIQKDN